VGQKERDAFFSEMVTRIKVRSIKDPGVCQDKIFTNFIKATIKRCLTSFKHDLEKQKIEI